jgi:WD40 repeat protein
MSVAVAAPPSPYKGLAPFEDSDFDALLFFGREVESEIISANLIASRITVLYGPSGVGKSSVLRAGVAHRLRQEDSVDVVIFSTWTGDPMSALIEEIGAGGESLVEAVEAGAEQAGGDLYLILDQFEEYFLYHEPEGEFGQQLAAILSSPALRVNVLVGMREDALARIDALKAMIPNLLGNRLRLERLDADAGRAAILGPIERYNTLVSPDDPVAIEPLLVDDILHQVTVGRVELSAGRGARPTVDENLIEAPFMQLVLARLWDLELERGSRTLRRETLQELGGAQRIVENHLERAMAELSPAEKGAAAAMYHFLVTPSGTKIAHGVSDLAGYASVDEREAAGVLQRLTAERIVRASSENGPSTTRYEIFHDVLADAVLAWRARFEADRRIDEERRAHRRRQRRLLAIGALALAGLTVMAAVAVYALAQRSNAQHQAELAKAEQAETEDALVAKDEALKKANKATKKANKATAKAEEKTKSERRAVEKANNATAQATASAQGEREARLEAEGLNHRLRVAVNDAQVQTRIAQRETSRSRRADRKQRLLSRTLREEKQLVAARALAAEAKTQLSVDPEQSVKSSLAAVGAYRIARRAAGIPLENTLREGILDLRLKAVLPGGGRPVKVARYSPDGKQILLAGTAGAWIFERVDRPRSHFLRQARPERDATERFSAHRLSPAGQLLDATFSHDGRLVAAGGNGNVVQVWDARTYLPLYALPHGDRVLSIAFSPDDRLIATGSADGNARLWDAASGVLLSSFPHLPGQAGIRDVRSVSFSPDGKRLLTVRGDRFARVYDVAGREQVLAFNHGRQVSAAQFSPDGRLVATVGANSVIAIWDASNDDAPLYTLTTGGDERFSDVRFSPDGTLVAVASARDTVAQVWNLGLKTMINNVTRHVSGVESVVFHPAYALIATAGRDGNAYIARSSGFVHAGLLGHDGRLNDVVFSPDGDELLTASDDGTARVWDARVDLIGPLPFATQHLIANFTKAVNTVAFSPDGRHSLATSVDGTARLYSGDRPGPTLRHGDAVTAAVFSRDGSRVLTASADGTARMSRTTDGTTIATFAHGARVNAADLSRDGRYVVTAGDGSAWLWNARSGKRLHRLADADEVNDARFSPDSKLVVTASADKTAAIWRVATGEKLATLVGHTDSVVAAAFSPGGRWVATASADSTARIWNAETGKLRWSLKGHENRITSLAFSHDGRWLATASVDQDARVWSVRTGEKVALLQIHQGPVRAVEFSADDRWVATAGPTAVGIWQTRKNAGWRQNPLYLVRVPLTVTPTRQVTDVAFSPRGWRIVFGSVDGSFRTFDCTLCGGVTQLSAVARAKLRSIVRCPKRPASPTRWTCSSGQQSRPGGSR